MTVKLVSMVSRLHLLFRYHAQGDSDEPEEVSEMYSVGIGRKEDQEGILIVILVILVGIDGIGVDPEAHHFVFSLSQVKTVLMLSGQVIDVAIDHLENVVAVFPSVKKVDQLGIVGLHKQRDRGRKIHSSEVLWESLEILVS